MGHDVVVVTGTHAFREALRRDDFSGRPKTFRNAYISSNYSDMVFTSACDHVTWMRNFAKEGIMEHLGAYKFNIAIYQNDTP